MALSAIRLKEHLPMRYILSAGGGRLIHRGHLSFRHRSFRTALRQQNYCGGGREYTNALHGYCLLQIYPPRSNKWHLACYIYGMKQLVLLILLSTVTWQAVATPGDSLMVRRLRDEIMLHGTCYENLRTLTKQIGHRLKRITSGRESSAMGRSGPEKCRRG